MHDSKVDFKDSNDALAYVEDSLPIDLHIYHNRLIEVFKPYLIPSEPGLYLPGLYVPVILYNNLSYLNSLNGDVIKSKEDLKQAIKGVDIINSKKVKHIPYNTIKLLLNNGTEYPVYSEALVNILFEFIKITTNKILRYKTYNRNLYNSTLKYFKIHPDEVIEDFNLEDYLTEQLDDLCIKIDNYINLELWRMYYFKLSTLTVYVLKGVDYRIYDWYVNKEKEEEEYARIAQTSAYYNTCSRFSEIHKYGFQQQDIEI